jgi:hypothetical protein
VGPGKAWHFSSGSLGPESDLLQSFSAIVSRPLSSPFGVTMEYNEEIFCTQYPLVTKFLRHSIYRTELYNQYNQNKVKSEFWTSTIDAHYLQAVIYWCGFWC